MKQLFGVFLISVPFLLILYFMKIMLFDSWKEFFIAWFFIICAGIVIITFINVTIGFGLKLLKK